jgi:signal transduction histidine kinase
LIGLVISAGVGYSAAPKPHKHVLLLYSDNVRLPFTQAQDEVFRERLSHLSQPVDIFSENLDSALVAEYKSARLAAEFYRLKFRKVHFDAIMAMKPAALNFVLSHRKDIFNGAPVVFCDVSSRDPAVSHLPFGVTGVEINYSLLPALALIRQVQPNVHSIALVFGSAPAETTLADETHQDLASAPDQSSVEFWQGLTPDELRTKLSAALPDTAVLYTSELEDHEGHNFISRDFLEEVASSSAVPIYSIALTYLDAGTIGGKMIDPRIDANAAANFVQRILNGENPQTLAPIVEPLRTVFDARLLKKFHIRESRLPAGSEILYGESSPLVRYWPYITAAVLFLLLETALVLVLVAERRRKNRAHAELRRLTQQLLQAQEEERRRVARDLHDDINQRLALLASEMQLMDQESPRSYGEFRSRIGNLSRQTEEILLDVQAISHRLHSSKLEYLGIAAAMKSHCKESAEQHRVQIDFSHDDPLPSVPYEVSLCLFRVLQEALRNAVKYSGTRHFVVRLYAHGGELILTVSDSGVGFDPEEALHGRGLGLVSMRERLHLVGGEAFIESSPNGGTTISARVPIRGATRATANVT